MTWHDCPVRTALLTLAVLMATADVGQAAEREWQTGMWGMPMAIAAVGSPYRNYAIETDIFRLDIQETVSTNRRALAAKPDTKVTFALEGDMVYVRQGTAERPLRLIQHTNKLKHYGAAGAGHFVKTVADQGLTVTLEDGSVWDLDPRRQDRTSTWQPLAGIIVSYDEEQADNGYNYFLNNTDEDEGALARLRVAGP
jgi:hypothetical protein